MTAASPEETALLPRLESVLGVLAAGNRFALAYSGGLDSRFLAHAAQRFGFEPVLLHIVGPHIPPEETDYARHWAPSRELAYEELPADPLDLALVASGDRRRCYACKRNLFSLLKARTDLPLCDGTNASDAGQYRPGIRAVEELGILSPLASAGLTKADIRRLSREALALGYRSSIFLRRPWLITGAHLTLAPGDPAAIREKMADLSRRRRAKQPLEYPSAGSTFKRPEGYFAGKLIEDAGLKGFSVGGAAVSEKHAGFVINKDHGTAADILELCNEVKRRVKENSGVDLEMEVKLLGDF